MARKEKKPEIQYDNKKYLRIPLKTHVVMRDDKLMDVVTKYASDALEEGDLLFVSEKIVAITQGRAIPLKDITPSHLPDFFQTTLRKHLLELGLACQKQWKWPFASVVFSVSLWQQPAAL